MQGIVIGRVGPQFRVHLWEDRREVRAWARRRLWKSVGAIWAGDLVEIQALFADDYVLTAVAPRRNWLDPPGVANLDLLLIVVSWDAPPLDERVIHRIRIAAHVRGIPTEIVVNKWDLLKPEEHSRWLALQGRYHQAGWSLRGISVHTALGLEDLRRQLQGRVSALAGPSGTGKSALLNALIPGARLRTGEVHPRTRRGRHTTTGTTLLSLPEGGWIADTPGFSRNVLGPEVTPAVVRDAFPWADLTGPSVRCQYDDCFHLHEPYCSVREAYERGDLAPEWYELYVQLAAEAQSGRSE
ncbi:MAG: ribosome small subunit-dependent GTPase A [Acidobacteria bacterium]|nr:ribosome small subunit-dependent GTPase A [Acidobacteriota bacterium]MDW7983960.1 ribosome small subunit-dependent GTPase A [Acidobacteriota bacterium]